MNSSDIKNARTELGLSQAEMARALGLTCVMTYAKWEQRAGNKASAAAVSAINMLIYMKKAGVLCGWLDANR